MHICVLEGRVFGFGSCEGEGEVFVRVGVGLDWIGEV